MRKVIKEEKFNLLADPKGDELKAYEVDQKMIAKIRKSHSFLHSQARWEEYNQELKPCFATKDLAKMYIVSEKFFLEIYPSEEAFNELDKFVIEIVKSEIITPQDLQALKKSLEACDDVRVIKNINKILVTMGHKPVSEVRKPLPVPPVLAAFEKASKQAAESQNSHQVDWRSYLAQPNWREQSNVDLLKVFKKTFFGEAAAEVVSKKSDAVEGPNSDSSPQI